MNAAEEAYRNELVRLRPALVAFCKKISRNYYEDIAQDTLLQALLFDYRFTSGSNMLAWLRKIAININLQYIYKASARREIPECDMNRFDYLSYTIEADDAIPEWTMPDILACIKQLPYKYQKILVLFARKLTHQEIARQMVLSDTNSRQLLRRARGKLFELLKERFDDLPGIGYGNRIQKVA